MRIALRTGGGRGVYELAGTQGPLRVADLIGRQIQYAFSPDIVINARAAMYMNSGNKPRIRLNDAERSRTTHFVLLLAGVLLLPKPIRALRNTSSSKHLSRSQYAITNIQIDIVSIETTSATIRPTDLELGNLEGAIGHIDFVRRLARVSAVWEAANAVNTKHSTRLLQHREAVLARDPNFKDIAKLSEGIATSLGTDRDPLPLLELEYGIEAESELIHVEERSQPISETDLGDNNPASPEQATLETVARWRRVPVRGPAAVRFRRSVRDAYEHRCLFSGSRLPKLEITTSPGVDAAHILPWASHGINSITNGICLNKLCHWAFDTGVLQLTYIQHARPIQLRSPIE